jgi:hypothetical protein
MLGFNGGLLGVRKVPTTGSASGLWVPNEQSVAQRAGIWPAGPPSDAHWGNVRLLLGGNSLPTTDESSFATPITTNTTLPGIDTSIAKFGAASLSYPGDINRDVRVANSNDNLDVATDEVFTWEGWIYIISVDADAVIADGSYAFIESRGSNTFTTGISRPSGGAQPRLFFTSPAGSFYHQTNITLDTWIHWAVVRDSSQNVYLYWNGVKSTSAGASSGYALDNSNALGFLIGRRQLPAFHNMRLDEMRFTVGTARYTADFTPPTAAFPRG